VNLVREPLRHAVAFAGSHLYSRLTVVHNISLHMSLLSLIIGYYVVATSLSCLWLRCTPLTWIKKTLNLQWRLRRPVRQQVCIVWDLIVHA